MFKKTKKAQLNLFSSPATLFSSRTLKIYENEDAWHNRFREQVTERIDEGLFSRLYCSDNGTPNASIKVLVAMMILKEAEGLSDQKLFENCRFNFLTRSAIGLFNADDAVPTESTYYLFRKRIVEDEKAGNENLLKAVFEQVTAAQCLEFEVSGKRVRMDSKLLSSNIAWLSRYELVHETLRVFWEEIRGSGRIGKETAEVLGDVLAAEGRKIVYRSTNEEVRTRLQELGELIWSVLAVFGEPESEKHALLKRVFEEQFEVVDGTVRAREKEKISAKTVQSPHDPDATYQDKNGNKCKGFTVNVTESCNDDGLNLIGQVEVEKAGTADVEFLVKGIEKAEEIFTGKVEAAHADGAYHSPDNQKYCEDRKIELHLNAIQGSKGRYVLEMDEGRLRVTDRETGQELEAKEIVTKKGDRKWRIRTHKGLKYFNQREIESSRLRKKAEDTPKEILQKRNNVEATIFQLAYHYPNGKSRYRGRIQHQMWANVRCLWVNFVRIWKYAAKGSPETRKSLNIGQITGFMRLIFEYQSYLRTICGMKSQKIEFSVS
jgi:hypothetical protein